MNSSIVNRLHRCKEITICFNGVKFCHLTFSVIQPIHKIITPMSRDVSAGLEEHHRYLRSLVDSLIVQLLALGKVPKLRPGKEIGIDALLQIKIELDRMIGRPRAHDLFMTHDPRGQMKGID